jgi:tetratricopeptide (TPR) repeat protein
VISGRCFELERSLFLQPILDGLGEALMRAGEQHLIADLPPEPRGVLAGLVPELRDLAGPDLLPAPVSAEAARLRNFSALAALLSDVSRRRPVLLTIDDLHEAGESTLEFLHRFVRTGTGRVLVLALVRAEERGRVDGLGGLAGTLELRGIGEPDVARIAAGSEFPEAAADLWQLTKGHPLYLREGLASLRETGTLTASTSLRQAIQARLGRAGPEVVEFLRAASVVGTVVDVELVAGLVSRDVAWGARLGEQGLRRGFLEESGTDYAFRHEILRFAIYGGVPAPTRVAWHRRIAESLRQRREAEEAVAHHAALGEAWELAARSYLGAGRKAASTFANRDAERLLSEAVAASAKVPGTGLEGPALLERGRIRVLLDDYDGADADLRQALALARQSADPALEASTLEQLAWSAYLARRLGAAAGYLNDVPPSVRTPSVLALSSRVHHALGDLDAGEREGAEALRRAAALGDRTSAALAASHLGSLAAHRDQYERAASLLEEAETSGRQLGLLRAVFNALHFRGLALGNLGYLAAALEVFDRLRREGLETGTRHYEGRALNGQAWMWLEIGDLPRAKDLAEEAHACSENELLAEPRANALLLLAELAFRSGDADASRALVAQADPLGLAAAYGWRFELRSLELLARIAALDGRHEDLAGRLTDAARRRGVPKYESLGLALTGRRDEACAIARRLGSDLLLCRVGGPEDVRAAVDRMAGRLPAELRERFARRRP